MYLCATTIVFALLPCATINLFQHGSFSSRTILRSFPSKLKLDGIILLPKTHSNNYQHQSETSFRKLVSVPVSLLQPDKNENTRKAIVECVNRSNEECLSTFQTSPRDQEQVVDCRWLVLIPDWPTARQTSEDCALIYPTDSTSVGHDDAQSSDRYLKGAVLKMAIVHDPPYVTIKNQSSGETQLGGLDIDALNLVARMLGFTYQIISFGDNSYGSVNLNGTWNGMMGLLQRKEVHMGLPALSPTPLRNAVVDTTYPISSTASRFLIRRPTSEVNYTTYILPFSLGVWILFSIFSVLFFACLVISALFRRVPVHVDYISSNILPDAYKQEIERMRQAFSLALSVIIEKGTGFQDDVANRILLLSFLLLSMLLMWSYSSVLVAFLTVDNTKMPFTTMEELVDNNDFRVGYVKSSAYEENLKPIMDNTGKQDVFFKLYEKIQKYPDNLVESNRAGIVKSYNEKYAFLSWIDGMHYEIGSNCSLTLSSEKLMLRSYGISLTKFSPYSEPFSRALMRLKEVGVLGRLITHHIPSLDSHCHPVKSNSNPLDFRHILPLFILLIVGIAVAVLALLVELLHFKFIGHG